MGLGAGGRPDRSTAKRVVCRAIELGIDFIDTADIYCLDETERNYTERLVAEALREAGGAGVLVATKGGMVRRGSGLAHDARPAQLRAACESSLRALGVERIDLYQLHAPDPAVPFEDSIGALARLLEEGRIAAVGLSNVTPAEFTQARAIVPIASVQNPLGAWDVSFRRPPLVEQCVRAGAAFVAYSPLGGGARAQALHAAPTLARLARQTGHAPAELVLAWLLRSAPNIIPIPGAARTATVESIARAAALQMDDGLARAVRRALRSLPGRQGLIGWFVGGVARRVAGLRSRRRD